MLENIRDFFKNSLIWVIDILIVGGLSLLHVVGHFFGLDTYVEQYPRLKQFPMSNPLSLFVYNFEGTDHTLPPGTIDIAMIICICISLIFVGGCFYTWNEAVNKSNRDEYYANQVKLQRRKLNG